MSMQRVGKPRRDYDGLHKRMTDIERRMTLLCREMIEFREAQQQYATAFEELEQQLDNFLPLENFEGE